VDELRYWRVFPKGIKNVGEFLREFMPNTYHSLWVPGVKFAGHYTAGTACTPARGTLGSRHRTGRIAREAGLDQEHSQAARAGEGSVAVVRSDRKPSGLRPLSESQR